MARPFSELRERLLKAGVAPRHVRRYLKELSEHLADLRVEEARAGRSPKDAEAAALTRLGTMDELARAMIEQRKFQSWSARTPWAIFGLVPIAILVGAYLIACLILWTGWQIFLPWSPSPFVRIDGLAIFYFGVGRMLYFGAPILAGWGIALLAARQRFRTAWPAMGLVLVALLGCMSQVHAIQPAVPGGVGHVSMGLTLGGSPEDQLGRFIYALVTVAVTVAPYFGWRLLKGRSVFD